MNNTLTKNLLSLIFMVLFITIHSAAYAVQNASLTIQAKLASLENTANGQLGVYAINTGNNQSIEYHANKRFPLCSTNKVMGVAAILKKSETHPDLLQKKITYTKSELLVWSPATEKHVNSGMTISELGKAAITLSDNAAINLIMKELGSPQKVTDFARCIGDDTFKLDRWELELNTTLPGDMRDTSTPKAMGNSLRKLVLGNVLAVKQRNLLQTWLIGNTTGDARIRAGTPKGWVVGDKTGTCGHYGTTNDVGIIWPKDGAPIVIAIYFTQPKEDAPARDDVIADTTQIVLQLLANTKIENASPLRMNLRAFA